MPIAQSAESSSSSTCPGCRSYRQITVENPRSVTRGVSRVELDGAPLAGGAAIALADDGATHRVRVVLG